MYKKEKEKEKNGWIKKETVDLRVEADLRSEEADQIKASVSVLQMFDIWEEQIKAAMLTGLTLGKKEETGWSYENARRVKDKQAIQLNKNFHDPEQMVWIYDA